MGTYMANAFQELYLSPQFFGITFLGRCNKVPEWMGLLRVFEIETRVVANGSSLQLDYFAGKLTVLPAVHCHEHRCIASHP
jgi:hypothetical protein